MTVLLDIPFCSYYGRRMNLRYLPAAARYMTQQTAIVEMVRSGRQTQAAAARLFRVHPATVSRLLALQQQAEPTTVHTPGDA